MAEPNLRDELEPCPFCGSPAEYKCEVEWTHLSASEAQHSGLGVSGGSIRHESHRVYCTNQLNCYASMGGWSADAAVKLWNRRTHAPALADMAKRLEEAERDAAYGRALQSAMEAEYQAAKESRKGGKQEPWITTYCLLRRLNVASDHLADMGNPITEQDQQLATIDATQEGEG